ncbi:hypothetical protein JA9_002558 [Meyerozyma sp. JA9]|nr:hypothetical protein JA9_002558 [Meyerozyma sp. JA9]
MSKFDNSRFHREGREKPQPKTKPRPKDSEFISELVQTGKANWKKAPTAVRNRYYGIYMILFSIPILILPSYEIWRRLEGKSTKQVQKGEILEGQQVRPFDEREKWEKEKNSLMYRIFGRDFFLDGFTSKTMRGKEDEKNEKNDK